MYDINFSKSINNLTMKVSTMFIQLQNNADSFKKIKTQI